MLIIVVVVILSLSCVLSLPCVLGVSQLWGDILVMGASLSSVWVESWSGLSQESVMSMPHVPFLFSE